LKELIGGQKKSVSKELGRGKRRGNRREKQGKPIRTLADALSQEQRGRGGDICCFKQGRSQGGVTKWGAKKRKEKSLGFAKERGFWGSEKRQRKTRCSVGLQLNLCVREVGEQEKGLQASGEKNQENFMRGKLGFGGAYAAAVESRKFVGSGAGGGVVFQVVCGGPSTVIQGPMGGG